MNKADELALVAILATATEQLSYAFDLFRGDPSGDYWALLTHWMFAVQQIDNCRKNKEGTRWAAILADLAGYDVPQWPDQLSQHLTGETTAFWLDKGDDK